ncbi:MAG: DUF2079 domain-containing protein, partial [Candidatus Eisenbacteria bacterium]|nr:DUF2079 domain-containing protein [Candidatus Eisenbacteria bacterium]
RCLVGSEMCIRDSGWAAGALVWAVVALYVVIPHFRGGASSDTLARYGWLGGEPGEILRTLVTRPWTLFATHYHRVRRAVFPLQLLWPYAGLPLFAIGRLLPALPNLGLSLASSAISQNSIYFQYNAPILPFFLWAGIAGSQKIAARGASSRGWAAAALLFGVLTANVADPAAWKDVPRPYTIVDGIRPRPNREAFAALASAIPAGADLLASNDLAPHFSERRSLHVFHTQRPNPQAEWAILDLTDRRHIQSAEEMARELQRMVREEGYGVLACRKGIVVLRRGQPSDPDALAGLRDALRADGLPAP